MARNVLQVLLNSNLSFGSLRPRSEEQSMTKSKCARSLLVTVLAASVGALAPAHGQEPAEATTESTAEAEAAPAPAQPEVLATIPVPQAPPEEKEITEPATGTQLEDVVV